ncbi:MAG: hypothetical protein WC119_04585 [Synergistaceae bacterium]
MKTIGIVGSRRRDSNADLKLTRKAFDAIYEKGDRIVSGHCPQGGDKFAEIIAKELGLTEENGKLILHRPKWNEFGKRAGFVRNTYIAEDADILIAVASADRKGGTEDTINKATLLDKKIIIVPEPHLNEFDPLEDM